MRLFIAINFPDDMRHRLWSDIAPLRDAGYPVRWVGAANIHMTVKFLGEVDDSRVDAICDLLARAAGDTRAFRIPVGQFGAFPTPKRPRVLWVGCENLPMLELLANAVERAMATVGFEPEARAFRPHATIGRVRRDARPSSLAGLAEYLARLEFGEEPLIDSIDLMRSHLGSAEPRYERLAPVELVR